MLRAAAALILIATFWVQSGCGSKKTENDQVDFNVSPGQPVVITANFTTPTGISVVAPWFQFTGTVNNNSSDTVTVIALSLVVTANNTDGTTSVQNVTVSPSDYNYTLVCSNTTSAPITFTDFGEIAAGASGSLSLTYRGVALPSDCASLNPNIDPVKIYIGGNPNGANIASYNYTVQLTPEGWFGTVDSPSERLTKTVYFSTQ